MLPYFIIIGAMKCGTTSLYRYLASHHDIISSSIKETDFFKTDKDFAKGIDWYESQFQGNGKYAFEASPNYTKYAGFPRDERRLGFHGVPERMHSILPNAKLIYLVRDPIERMISHYIHSFSIRSEKRLFSQVVRDISKGSIGYVQTGRYHFQIQAYLEYFSEEQILLIESEKLRKNTAQTLSKVLSFLDIQFDLDPSVVERKFHQSKEKKRKTGWETMIRRKIKNPILIAYILKVAEPFRKIIERPSISAGEKEILIEAYRYDVEKLRQFSGLKFTEWSL